MSAGNKFFSILTCILLFVVITTYGQVNIILDTDIGSDCDDAGALAVLHKLADKGETNILGVIFSSGKNKYGIGVIDAINTYYGRGDTPLGQYKRTDVGDPKDNYSKEIATTQEVYGHDVVDSTNKLVKSYKDILDKQPHGSVTIVTIGHPHGLVYLLRDPTGVELIKQKVDRWVAMTHTNTEPHQDWNFGRNGAQNYIQELLKKWPADVYFSGEGSDILTGNKKLPSTPKNNPVRKAYELWNNALEDGRSSWDQLAVLFAVRPEYFQINSDGSLQQNNESKTFWNTRSDNSKHYKVIPKIEKTALENTIEELMSQAPLYN